MRVIDSSGTEGQITANFIEQGGCLCGCTKALNMWRHANGKQSVCTSTVHDHIMKYMIILKKKTRKVPQGSFNPYSPWSLDTFKWIKQLSIRCGKLDPILVKYPPMPPPPKRAEWDETHPKTRIGMATAQNKNYQLSFKCSSNGKLSSNGQFDNRDPVQARQYIDSTYL
eukprot:4143812-Ditylum_brightwellii.AAC.1